MIDLMNGWKMMGRVAFWITLGCLMAANSYAAEYGIGLTANRSDLSLYMPIKLTDNFRTEISVGYQSAEAKADNQKQEADQIEAGIGLFFTKDVYPKTQLYYGCRLLYLYENRELSRSSGTDYSVRRNGFGIAPTLGFEYFMTEQISLGGEVEFYYRYLDGKDDDGVDFEETTSGTDSRVVIRYYF